MGVKQTWQRRRAYGPSEFHPARLLGRQRRPSGRMPAMRPLSRQQSISSATCARDTYLACARDTYLVRPGPLGTPTQGPTRGPLGWARWGHLPWARWGHLPWVRGTPTLVSWGHLPGSEGHLPWSAGDTYLANPEDGPGRAVKPRPMRTTNDPSPCNRASPGQSTGSPTSASPECGCVSCRRTGRTFPSCRPPRPRRPRP